MYDEEYEKELALMQAEADANLKHDLAAAAAARDPIRNEYRFFLMLLRQTRQAQKLSQTQLAEKLGTTQSVISRIESCKGNPSLRTIMMIAQALDTQLVLE